MPAKVFVGNLAHGVTAEVIRPLFEHYGTVTECDILGSYGFVVSFTGFLCCCCRLICITSVTLAFFHGYCSSCLNLLYVTLNAGDMCNLKHYFFLHR